VFCSIYTTISDHSNLVLDNLHVVGIASVERWAWSRGWLVQRVKPVPFDLGVGVLDRQTNCESPKGPQQATDGCCHECAYLGI